MVQTQPADEIIIVEDGPIGPGLKAVLDDYKNCLPITTIRLEKNSGQGVAANVGLQFCSHDLIARMDSDDVCGHERFAKQVFFMQSHPEIDVLGANILEFNAFPEDGEKTRTLPSHHRDIVKFAKSRSPINNVTAMFRKDAALKAGGYRPWRGFEDYYLWTRMLIRGSKFHNLDEILVYVRGGNGMQYRRGGFRYTYLEVKFLLEIYDLGFLSIGELLKNILLRCPFRLLPPFIRSFIYRNFLRS